jgi:hypothetical protein
MPHQLPDEVLYDVRLIERHLNRGVLNPKDLEKRLGALEDLSEQSETTTFDDIEGKLPSKEPAKAAAVDRNVN